MSAAPYLAGLQGGWLILRSLPLWQQHPRLVFFWCISGSPSAAWGCCSPKAAGTLGIPGDTGEVSLFKQVVLGDALSLLVAKLPLCRLSSASFSSILPLPFRTSRSNLSSRCFFPPYVPEWFWVWLWSQSLLFTQVRNPRSILCGWRASPMLCQLWQPWWPLGHRGGRHGASGAQRSPFAGGRWGLEAASV